MYECQLPRSVNNMRENYLHQINSNISENQEHQPKFWPDYVKLSSMEPQATKLKAKKARKRPENGQKSRKVKLNK